MEDRKKLGILEKASFVVHHLIIIIIVIFVVLQSLQFN